MKLTLLAAAAVLLIIGVVVAAVFAFGSKTSRGGSAAGSASDAVKNYLEALSKGDAETALALGAAQPGSTKFLTSEALKRQIETWPITNIRILNDTSAKEPGDFALVNVAADFGPNHSEAEIPVTKTDDGWKLKSATINMITMSGILKGGPAASLSMLGSPIGTDSNLYVFPGFLDLKSTVPYVDVSSKPLLLESMLAGDVAQPLEFDLKVNEAGHKAVNEALEKWITGCLSDPASQYNCPAHTFDTPINRSTARIVGPIDLSGVTQTEMPMSMSIMTTGNATYQFTAQTTAGQNATFNSKLVVATSVDLSKVPAVVGPIR